MKNLATSHTSAQIFFKEKNTKMLNTASKILMDLVIEMTINRSSKESGALTGTLRLVQGG